jgi:hypothetical protein
MENRETATAFIQEMIDARRRLTEDPSLELKDVPINKNFAENILIRCQKPQNFCAP